jgi:hypothetical protein
MTLSALSRDTQSLRTTHKCFPQQARAPQGVKPLNLLGFSAVKMEDVEKALETGLHLLELLACSPAPQKKEN